MGWPFSLLPYKWYVAHVQSIFLPVSSINIAFFVLQVTNLLFWPAVVGSILLGSFAQMLFTSQNECNDALGDVGACSINQSYKLVYYLVVGEPIVDLGGENEVARSMTALIVLLMIALFVLGLSIFSVIVLASLKWDFENVAVSSFWEPKLIFVLFSCSNGKVSPSNRSLPSRLEIAWHVATNILSGREYAIEPYWYTCLTGKSALMKVCRWLIASLVVPLWIAAGVLTFGVLWPPQVRRFLFQPSMKNSVMTKRSNLSPAESYACQVSRMRDELSQIRDMSYERSNDIQREVRELKEILHVATAY